MTFKELNFSFMLLRGCPRGEGSQVAPLAGFGIFLAGIQAVLSGRELPNHKSSFVSSSTSISRRV